MRKTSCECKAINTLHSFENHLLSSQGLTFKDGNVGVDFAGYSAQAGLGGLLTGNAAHGGLSASAGTPGGQRAVAGLGGNTGKAQLRRIYSRSIHSKTENSLAGDLSGGLYAGATAGQGVGATAALGGSANSATGYGGAEAHGGGISKSVTSVAGSPAVSCTSREH